MLGFSWSLSDDAISLVSIDGSSSQECSFRASNDLSMLYILTYSLSGVTDGSTFTLPAVNDNDFNTSEALLWKIFVLTVWRIKICNPWQAE